MSAAAKRYKVNLSKINNKYFAEHDWSPWSKAHLIFACLSTCVGFSTSDKWTLSLHFGRWSKDRYISKSWVWINFFCRCSTCSTDHSKSTVISNIERSVALSFCYVEYGDWRPHFLDLMTVLMNQETKAQYARDDPAFLVLLSAVLIVTSAGFSFTLGLFAS